MLCKESEEHSKGQGVNQGFLRRGITRSALREGRRDYGQRGNRRGTLRCGECPEGGPLPGTHAPSPVVVTLCDSQVSPASVTHRDK